MPGDAVARSETPSAVVLGERYELSRLLGTGGSGAVYLAHDRVLRRDVAVKLLRSPQDDLARARLNAEARHAAAIAHPGVARLLDVGEDEGAGGTTPYLVMEYVDGRTLRDLLRSGERLSIEQVLALIAQVAEALAAVHAAGIIHRDLKPGNIMLTGNGRAVLLDFGIARHHDGEPLTMTGTIVGTVDYISPEQASGASASTASDVYALGMVAYECLTGILPLSRDTQISTLMAHAATQVPPVPPTVPVAVRDLVQSMVALVQDDRPTSAAVATWAGELLHDSARLRAVPTAPAGARRPRAVVVPDLIHSRHGRYAIAAACAVLAALVGGLVLEGKGRSADPAAADVTTAASPSATPTHPKAAHPKTATPDAGTRPVAAATTPAETAAHRRAVTKASPHGHGQAHAAPAKKAGHPRPPRPPHGPGHPKHRKG